MLIGVLRGTPDARIFLTGVLEKNQPIFTTIFNEYELWAGACLRGEREEKEAAVLLSTLKVLQASSKSAEGYGRLYSYFVKKGLQLPETGLMIASVAIENGEPIATRNEKHFSKIPGLKVIKW